MYSGQSYNRTSFAKFKMSSMFVKNKSVPASDKGRLVYAFSLQLAISFLKPCSIQTQGQKCKSRVI